MVDAAVLRSHAESVSAEQFRRARGRLEALAPAQQDVVEELALSVGRSVAEMLAERARGDPVLAAALVGAPTGSGPRAPG
jgi:hypothetical protein